MPAMCSVHSGDALHKRCLIASANSKCPAMFDRFDAILFVHDTLGVLHIGINADLGMTEISVNALQNKPAQHNRRHFKVRICELSLRILSEMTSHDIYGGKGKRNTVGCKAFFPPKITPPAPPPMRRQT